MDVTCRFKLVPLGPSACHAPHQLDAEIGVSVGMELDAQRSQEEPTCMPRAQHVHHSCDARLFWYVRSVISNGPLDMRAPSPSF